MDVDPFDSYNGEFDPVKNKKPIWTKMTYIIDEKTGNVTKSYGYFDDNGATKEHLHKLNSFEFNFTMYQNYSEEDFSTKDSSIKWSIKYIFDVSTHGMAKVTMDIK